MLRGVELSRPREPVMTHQIQQHRLQFYLIGGVLYLLAAVEPLGWLLP
jgi:hypothetical protein